MIRSAYRRSVPESTRWSVYQARAKALRAVSGMAASVADRRLLLRRSRLRRLRGGFEGQRCFVMGNGPSLNLMDLSALAQEQVWGVNRCHLLFDRIQWRPRFYVSQDSLAMTESPHEIARVVEENPEMLCFLPTVYGKRRSLTPAGSNLYWVDSHRVDVMRPEGDLGVDLRQVDRTGVATTYTVTATALQLAAFVGFRTVYLIGCDNSYAVPAEDVVVDANDRVRALRVGERPDVNHFDDRYHRPGDKWNLPPDGGHERSFELVGAMCRAVGTTVYNATVGGTLEVFPRVPYEEVVGTR